MLSFVTRPEWFGHAVLDWQLTQHREPLTVKESLVSKPLKLLEYP